MLFMVITTVEPEKRDEVMKRRLEKGLMAAQGLKVVGEWQAIAGGRAFVLCEVDDPKAALATAAAWSDLVKMESVPVIETQDALKLMQAR
jgi:hypothetical protein